MNWNLQRVLSMALGDRKQKLETLKFDALGGPVDWYSQQILDGYIKECDVAADWVREHTESPRKLIDKRVKGIINFTEIKLKTNLRTYQKELIAKLVSNDKVKVNWTRQSGKDTVLLHYLAYIATQESCNILVSSNNYAMDRDMINDLSDILKGSPKTAHLIQTSKSIITSYTQEYKSRRNYSQRNIVLLNEYDYNKCNMSEFLTDDEVICVSRELKDPFFVEHRSHWYDAPGRDERWKRSMIARIGQDSWNKEFEVD